MISREQYTLYIRYLFYLGIVLMIIGLYFSRALLSIGTGIAIGIPFIQPNVWNKLTKFYENKAALAISGIFFLYLLSGINSIEKSFWLERVRVNIPTLFMPISFMLIKPLSRRVFHLLFYLFLLATALSVGLVLGNYYMSYDTISQTYLKGQVMPTPVIYVRYSLMVAIAIIVAIYLLIEQFVYRWKWEKYLQIFIALFLLFFIHLLAVRTGMLSLYVGLLTTALYYVFQTRQVRLGIGIIALLCILPFLLYLSLPTLRNKVQYVIWDWKMYLSGNTEYQPSDYIRVYSITHGLKLVQEHPLLGVGMGDMVPEMNQQYEIHTPQIPKEERFLPINQYVFILTATGIVGLAYFIFATWYPLFYQKNYQNYFMLTFHLALFASFIGETTIELQIGKTVYLLFVLLCLSYLDQSKKDTL